MIGSLFVVVAVLACASCSASSSGGATSTTDELDAPSLSATAATGPEISGTGYSFHVPDGRGDPDRSVPGFDLDSFALNRRDKDAFADNVNVLVLPGGSLTPDQAESAARDELEGVGFEDVTINSRVQVAGSVSAHVTGQASINDLDYTVEQF